LLYLSTAEDPSTDKSHMFSSRYKQVLKVLTFSSYLGKEFID
jgi:hypothetical protein